MNTKHDLFTKIARKHLLIETLETRNRDCLDFHEVGVVGVQRALQDAYDAGRADASHASESLLDAIRDNLSPHAVALILAKCQPFYGRSETGQKAEREVTWFRELLFEMISGDQFNQLCEELGM